MIFPGQSAPRFLPYQLRWVDDSSSLKIIEKSRQIGLSFCTAYSAVKRAAARDARLNVWVSSRDKVQARLFLEDCRQWAEILHIAATESGESIIDPLNSCYVLKFKNGRTISSLSSNPNALAGKRGHVILDEFALHADQRLLYRVAKPVTTWGGQLEIISTHRGANSVFNQILTDIKERGNPMGWSHHRVTIQDAVAQGLAEKINARSDSGSPSPGGEGGPSAPTTRINTRAGSGSPSPGAAGEASTRINTVAGCGSPSPGGEGRGEGGLSTASARINTRLGSGSPSPGAAGEASTRINTRAGSGSPSPGGEGRGEGGPSAPATRAQFLARLESECLDQEQWLQEYCCVPSDESTAFLTYEMITACEADCLEDFAYLEQCENPLFLGIDVGRRHDLTIMDVGEKIGDVVWDRLRLELANTPFSEQERELYRLLHLPRLQRACIDASGLGMQLAERAREQCGWKVEPVTFTAPVKEELAWQLRTAFEDRLVRVPRDDRLLADLRGVKKEITIAGNTRFGGESADSHCDRFWAKALRQQAARYRADSVGAAVA